VKENHMKSRTIVRALVGVGLGAVAGLALNEAAATSTDGTTPSVSTPQEIDRIIPRQIRVLDRNGNVIRDCAGKPILVDSRDPEAALVAGGPLARSALSDPSQPAGRLNAEGVEVGRPRQWVAHAPRC
jgi:hypothetical protein